MKLLFLLLFCVSLFSQTKTTPNPPNLLLLNIYTKDTNVTGWYMSEKLDGVRAYWDGKQLVSRQGVLLNPPAFFTKEFPTTELDGELWSKRGDFANVSSIVNTQESKDGWKNLTYKVFEVPHVTGGLLERLATLKESKYIQRIPQIKIKNRAHLEEFLKSVEAKGGEGVVVRDESLEYYTGRNNNALKVKSYIDEECEVVGYTQGEGKYKGMTGSLLCKTQQNKRIKIGTGLSDMQRENPPKIGSMITFKYYGLTSKGNPRFPVFMRERN